MNLQEVTFIQNNNYEAPRYVFFSNLLLFRPTEVQTFSSEFCSQLSSVYVVICENQVGNGRMESVT
jgi:hypothetical protein